MQIGYDYLLQRPRFPQRFIQATAGLLFVTGALLLVAGVAYFVYAQQATSNLTKLNIVTAPATGMSPDRAEGAGYAGAGVVPVVPVVSNTNTNTTVLGSGQKLDSNPGNSLANLDHVTLQISPDAIESQQMYPGLLINPSAWGDILGYEPASSVEASLIQGFVPVDPSLLPHPGSLANPDNIIIPSIGVKSEVEGLQIRDLGSSRAYETPDNIVGHIPEGSNPGEAGSTWYFGHLESPIAREGNVFYQLPQIPDMLRKGQEVYAVVESASGSFLYQMTEALVVKAEDLTLSYEHLQQDNPEYANLDPNGANIHLVACVPRLVYDHRLVVSGQLIGVRQ